MQKIFEYARSYYEPLVEHNGLNPLGVGWNGTASQTLRFEQLVKIIPPRTGTFRRQGGWLQRNRCGLRIWGIV